jgi:hypothetical protein
MVTVLNYLNDYIDRIKDNNGDPMLLKLKVRISSP